MIKHSNYQLSVKVKLWSRYAALATVFVAGCVLIGWTFDTATLKSMLPGLTTMKVNTALMIILSGMALWLLNPDQVSVRNSRLAQAGVLIVFVMGVLTLVEYGLGLDFGIDQLLFRDVDTPLVNFPGRMSVITASGFVVLGISIFLMNNKWSHWFSTIPALGLLALASLALIGYMYGANSMYTVGPFSPIAVHTALCFLLLSLSILFARPERGPMRVFLAADAGGATARRLIPLLMSAALITSRMIHTGRDIGLYDEYFERSLTDVSFIMGIVLIVGLHARRLSLADVVRRHAEDKLRASETKFRKIIDASPVPYALNDEHQNVTYLNAAFTQTFGYDLKDIPTLADWWPRAYPDAEYREWVAEMWQARLDKAKRDNIPFEPLELNIRSKDNTQRTAIVGAASLTESFSDIHLVTLFDITERKQAEERLRKSEERYRSIFQTAMVSIWEEDYSEVEMLVNELRIVGVNDFRKYLTEHPEVVHRAAHAVKILDVNDITLKMYGAKDKAELLGSLGALIESGNFRDELIAFAEGQSNFETEALDHKLDGSLAYFLITVSFFTDADGRHKALVCLNDITARRQAEKALQAAEQDYRSIFENAPIGIFQTTPAGRYLRANSAVAEIYGYASPEDLIQGVDNIARQIYVNPDSRRKFQDLLKEQGEVVEFENQNFRKDGSVIWTSTNARAVRNAENQIIYYEGFIRDVTGQKQVEEKLTSHAENMATLSQLSQQILTTLDMDRIYIETHAATQKFMPCDSFVIAILDEAKQEIEDVYLWDGDQRWLNQRYPVGRGLANFVITSGQPLHVNEWDESHERLTNSTFFGNPETKSVLAVPLLEGNGRSFGIISAQSYTAGVYTTEHEQLLITLASQVAKAMENARLFNELQQELEMRRRVEEKLRDSEDRFLSFMNNNTTISWMKDEQGRHVYLSESFEKQHDVRFEDWQGKTDFELWPREVAEVFWKNDQEVLRNEKPLEITEETKNPDGSSRYWLNFKFPFRDASGKKYVGGIGIDITARKQAEEKIKESEALYRSVFSVLSEGLVVQDTSDKILVANDAAARILGLTMDQLLGRDSYDPRWQATHEDGSPFRPEDHPSMITLHTGLPVDNTIMKVNIGDGHRAVISINSRPTYDDGGNVSGVVVSFSDITERKDAEYALSDSRSQLSGVIESAMDAIVTVNADQVITLFNAAAEKMFRYSAAEVIEKPLDILLPERYRGIHRNHIRVFDETGVTTRAMGALMPLSGVRADGDEFPIEASISQIIVAGRKLFTVILRDITLRKQAEEHQIVLYETLRAIGGYLDENEIARAAVDTIGRLGRWGSVAISIPSPGYETWQTRAVYGTGTGIYGRPRPMDVGVIGRAYRLGRAQNVPDVNADVDHFHGYFPTAKSELAVPIRRGGRVLGVIDVESDHLNAFNASDERLLESLADTISLALDNAHLYAAVQAELNERRRAEDQIQKLNLELEQRVIERTAQLEAANKELEAFSYSVSHDLRAPLRGIDGFGKALVRKYEDQLGEDGKHYLSRIQENTLRMGQLIDDLLSLSRVTRREMRYEHVSLTRIAREIADGLMRDESGRQVLFEIEDQVETQGDPGLLKIVLENLLGNAFKFTSTRAQAKIQFGVHHPEAGEKVKTEGLEKIFFVCDNGVGFDMAYADKLFGAFQRLHAMDEFPGTGIGLATVQRIIQRHNGTIWVEADIDKGATFYFTLGGRA